ncbi:MAG TPA: hypothetical protein VFI59_01985 [Actinomycetota bacterium]|nr:hypothetical protein [Actinomycetota bacterium]
MLAESIDFTPLIVILGGSGAVLLLVMFYMIRRDARREAFRAPPPPVPALTSRQQTWRVIGIATVVSVSALILICLVFREFT